ncbi:MAG: NAD(P)H-dependent oxidoreductase [Verrucomicrobiota bacterium]
MNPIPASDIVDALKWRYATKVFDTSRKIPQEIWTALEDSLVLTPSSFGLQPWKFLVITDEDTKLKLLPHSWNQAQVTQCSHLVVFAVQTTIDEATIDRFLQATADSRGEDISTLDGYRKMIVSFLIDSMDAAQQKDWAIKQTYIALGQFMLAAAMAGVDTCPMEGFMPAKYNEVLSLNEKSLTAAVVCPAGYRSDSDKYGHLPKIRYDKSDLIKTY